MEQHTVCVTGGAGYVGSVLVPKLLDAGHKVKVLDLYTYGDTLAHVADHPRLEQIRGDIRDPDAVARAVAHCTSVIHLACISNDPSFELDPELGRSINHTAFRPLVRAAKAAGVSRFIYASSSSVYGVKSEPNVHEELPLEPLTDYSRYKAICEQKLAEEREPGFTTMTIRPATVCGWSPRLRLDLVVNILTAHAYTNRLIKVFGGDQLRPNIHIQDMTDLYVDSLQYPSETIDGQTFNAGYHNHTVNELADMVRAEVGDDVTIEHVPTDDDRSYHVSSQKIKDALGFAPKHSIQDAIAELVQHFDNGDIQDPLDNDRYHNIKRMQNQTLATPPAARTA